MPKTETPPVNPAPAMYLDPETGDWRPITQAEVNMALGDAERAHLFGKALGAVLDLADRPDSRSVSTRLLRELLVLGQRLK